MLADRTLLFNIDVDAKELYVVADAAQHLFPTATSACDIRIRIPLSDGLLGYVARTGTSICLPDAKHDPRFNINIDKKMNYTTTSLMALPVFHAEDPAVIIAVLLVSNKVPPSPSNLGAWH